MQKYFDENEYIYAVQKCVMYKHGKGISESLNIIYPLSWYITTGRASASFIKAMYEVKPYVMARLLFKGYSTGSHDDVVEAIKNKVEKISKNA